MANDSTLHVKINSDTDKQLKELASTQKTSKGQLVREAIAVCYQASFASLPLQQKQALAAYQGGYISIGKLAKEMGMHVLDLRRWLNEHGIVQQVVYGANDAGNA